MKKRVATTLCLLAVFFVWHTTSCYAGRQPFRITSRDERQYTIEWHAPPVIFVTHILDGQTIHLPQMSGLPLDVQHGEYALPVAALPIEIPRGASVFFSIEDSLSIPVKGTYNIPCLDMLVEDRDDQVSGISYRMNAENLLVSPYDRVPKEILSVGDVASIGGRTLARVVLRPLIYSPATQKVRKLEALRARVWWDYDVDTLGKPASPSRTTAAMDRIIDKALGDGSKKQRFAGQSPLPRLLAHSWRRTDYPYFKLYILQDALYGISGRNLDSLGVEISGIDPSTFQIFVKGEEVPLDVLDDGDGRFDLTDRIVFYGTRRPGDSTYYAAYSDTNVYWLTWGQQPGLRYSPKSVPPSGAKEIFHFRSTRHFEEEKSYYHGDNDANIMNTFLTPGEGWIWNIFFPGDLFRHTFTLPDFAISADSICIAMRLRGTTTDAVSPDHHVQLLLNNELVGELYFDNRQDTVWENSVTGSLVAAGENKLEIKSIGDTGADRDQFYLDWIEVTYPRLFKSISGQFDGRMREELGARTVIVTDLPGDSILAYDVSKALSLHGVEVGHRWHVLVEVESAGYWDGNYARFRLNGEDIYSGSRGHSLVVIDQASGAVLAEQSFDTWASSEQADSMAAFIENLPEGRIVLAGIRDEGTARITESALRALESMGSALARQVGDRDSWAMIGIKGATKGTVAEAWTIAQTGAAVVSDTLSFQEGGSNSVAFSDTLHSTSHIVVCEVSALRRPVRFAVDRPTNLLSSANKTDYLILTHPLFLSAAEELASFRQQQNNFNTAVVLIEDIYDEFNYGLSSPYAIRDFVAYAYNNWDTPPSYLLLLGDANWDSKGSLTDGVKRDYMPSFGSPVSDTWFACVDGPEDILPDLFVGRIPAESAEEAMSVVQKVIEYEMDSLPDAWKKQVLFINGGFEQWEQAQFGSQSRFLADSIVSQPPASCQTQIIGKTSQGYLEGEHLEEILEALNSGMLWTNFVGHAGSRTWDLMFHDYDIDQLRNYGRYPFITSMTCHTARFANPESNSFGENFLSPRDHGAIAFWGSSGWGYIFQDYVLLTNLFSSVLTDTVHVLGDATTLTKLLLWTQLGSSGLNRNVVLQYTLLGDPATNIALPELPDLTLTPSDISHRPLVPIESDSLVDVSVKIHNYGLSSRDSVEVSLWARSAEVESFQVDSVHIVKPVGWIDSTVFKWGISGLAGSFEVEAKIDPHDLINETVEADNVVSTTIPIYSSSLLVSKPFDCQVVESTAPTLEVLNPSFSAGNDLFFEFEIDTSAQFNSTMLQHSPFLPAGTLVTRWAPRELARGMLNFWRARAITDSQAGAWVYSRFYVATRNEPLTWSQDHPLQFESGELRDVKATSSGVSLGIKNALIRVESAGYDDGNFARLLLDGEPLMESHRGHNVATINPSNGQVLSTQNFDTYKSSADADLLASFIGELPEGTVVLAAIADEGSANMTEAGLQALESIGSALCRNVSRRDSWAIIGIKGAAVSSVPEQHVSSGQGVAAVHDTLTFFAGNGQICSPVVGPARRWETFTWEEVAESPDTKITCSVLGFDHKQGQWHILIDGLFGVQHVNLSDVDPQVYARIKLCAELTTESGDVSPVLRSWGLAFEPAPDLAIDEQTTTVSNDTILAGEDVDLTVDLFNIGQSAAENVVVCWSYSDATERVAFGLDTVRTDIEPDSSFRLMRTWSSTGLAGSRKLFIQVDPEDNIAEPVEFNNELVLSVVIVQDSLGPDISVTFDGKRIAYGEFVSPQPQITAFIRDNSQAPLEDTSAVHVLLDDQRLSFASPSPPLELIPRLAEDDPQLRATVTLQPTLETGTHALELFVKDANGNQAYHREEFEVASSFELRNVFNYPNPFYSNTEFTYVLTAPADRIDIKVYTLAGRLIRTFENAPTAAGFNQLQWDGRDDDGDTLANGVYLYKIAAVQGEHRVERIEKLVVME